MYIYSYHEKRGPSLGFFSVDANESLVSLPFPDKNELYLGVEVEVDVPDGESIQWNTDEFGDDLENGGFLAHFIPSSDSSLEDGVEFVSAPTTLDAWHKIRRRVTDGFEAIKMTGLRAHETTTCGLHVHVSRAYFKDNYNAWSNLLIFVERNWPAMAQFARRAESSYAPSVFKNNGDTALDDIKSYVQRNGENFWQNASNNRRYVVNYRNTDTIEFRFFRGTLNIETFYATLQFVSNMCNLAMLLPPMVAVDTTMADIIDYNRYPELVAYARRRKLSINSDANVTTFDCQD